MKILIISNNPLSKSGSNGRTMLNMLEKFKKDQILNIFISGDDPSFDSALFYQIKDKNVLKFKRPYGCFLEQKKGVNNSLNKKVKKSVFKCLIRSLVWSKKSVKKEFLKIASEFKPDKLVIQCGDSDFLIKISCWLSNKLNTPLISFNSEDYIFKTWNYIEKRNHASILYKIFIRNLYNAYNLLYKNGVSFVYLTDSLKDLYVKSFPNQNAFVIYNSSDLVPVKQYNKNGDIVYCGNVGVGRLECLINFSNEIYQILNKKVKIYSRISDNLLLESLSRCNTIEYMGFISYEECIEVQKNASYLLLVESFDKYYQNDTKNAFSTKISDSLRLGIPLIALLPETSFAYKYLYTNRCAILGSSVMNVVNQIKNISKKDLDFIVDNAIRLSEKNHKAVINSEKFYNILK